MPLVDITLNKPSLGKFTSKKSGYRRPKLLKLLIAAAVREAVSAAYTTEDGNLTVNDIIVDVQVINDLHPSRPDMLVKIELSPYPSRVDNGEALRRQQLMFADLAFIFPEVTIGIAQCDLREWVSNSYQTPSLELINDHGTDTQRIWELAQRARGPLIDLRHATVSQMIGI